MTVLCPGCQRRIRIPPEKEDTPNLKAKCGGCGTVFLVEEASLALAPAPEVEARPPAAPPAAPGPLPSTGGAARPPATPAATQARAAAATGPSLRSPTASARGAARPGGAAESPTGAARASSPARTSRTAARATWRRCANHAGTASTAICTQCGKGWCAECARKQGTATICTECDALCEAVTDREAREERERRRAIPLRSEIGAVFAYPFSDKVAFLILSVVVGVFLLAGAFAAFGGGYAFLFSQGLVLSYAFTAINRISAGQMKGFMPEISDLADLVGPVRHGFAALLVSSGPLLLMALLLPGAVPAWISGGSFGSGSEAADPSPASSPSLPPEVQAMIQEAEARANAPADAAEALEEDEPAGEGEDGELAGATEDETSSASSAGEGSHGQATADGRAGALDSENQGTTVPPWLLAGGLVLALAWKIVYAPVALIAAAISRSFLSTLNPLVGIGAIRRMGSIYWEAMLLYTVLAVAETVLGWLLGLIPVAGHVLRGFVQSYCYLAIGCLLGLAVFKKAPELGLD